MAERVCRCLLREQASTRPLYEIIQDYLDTLPEEHRADDQLYQARLNLCRDCTELRNGTCVLCGCYVEARAAKRGMSCPMVPPRWEKE